VWLWLRLRWISAPSALKIFQRPKDILPKGIEDHALYRPAKTIWDHRKRQSNSGLSSLLNGTLCAQQRVNQKECADGAPRSVIIQQKARIVGTIIPPFVVIDCREMDFLVETFLILALPSIAAFVAVGSAGKRLVWYTGTAVLVFAVDIFMDAGFMAYAQTNHLDAQTGTLLGLDATQRAMLTWFMMLIVAVAMISIAANSGKKCRFCMSRIDPKAVRCPRCQGNLGAPVGNRDNPTEASK
jgi:hypothetical protein